MRILSLVSLALLLAGCSIGGARLTEPAYYDLFAETLVAPVQGGSDSEGRSVAISGVKSGGIEVQAPSWLATSAMQYRLRYADAGRRSSFVESRWAAPPAELLEVALMRRNAASASPAIPEGCRLHIDLDEFAQVFDTPESSRAVLEVRVTLQSLRGEQLLAPQHFIQATPAGADAGSGVIGFSGAVRNLGAELNDWLAQRLHEAPALRERCHAKGIH